MKDLNWMKVAGLSKNQIEYINKIGKAEIERNNGNVDLVIEWLNDLWRGIPEPKYEYREIFLVAWLQGRNVKELCGFTPLLIYSVNNTGKEFNKKRQEAHKKNWHKKYK